MTAASRSYAQSIRRLAELNARAGLPVSFTLDPASAIYLAHLLERGCGRSEYVRTVQAEAEKLRDMAEDELLKAQDLNAAADRALRRARIVERTAQGVAVATVVAVMILAGVLA